MNFVCELVSPYFIRIKNRRIPVRTIRSYWSTDSTLKVSIEKYHDTVGPATMSFYFETDEEAEIAAEKLDEVIRDSHV